MLPDTDFSPNFGRQDNFYHQQPQRPHYYQPLHSHHMSSKPSTSAPSGGIFSSITSGFNNLVSNFFG
ncbi:hypothetical protein M8J77_015470 [Diaphorina citri]|nr:hypothetical protein M8J77_015470 [Diaphorina citri]